MPDFPLTYGTAYLCWWYFIFEYGISYQMKTKTKTKRVVCVRKMHIHFRFIFLFFSSYTWSSASSYYYSQNTRQSFSLEERIYELQWSQSSQYDAYFMCSSLSVGPTENMITHMMTTNRTNKPRKIEKSTRLHKVTYLRLMKYKECKYADNIVVHFSVVCTICLNVSSSCVPFECSVRLLCNVVLSSIIFHSNPC